MSRSCHHSVRAFDLACIALGVTAAWGFPGIQPAPRQHGGVQAKAAGAIIRAANANGKDAGAAFEAAVSRIDASFNIAKQRGDLAFFNGAYKARKAAAQARGCGFMTYGQALRRLRKAVAGAAANGGQCTRSVMLCDNLGLFGKPEGNLDPTPIRCYDDLIEVIRARIGPSSRSLTRRSTTSAACSPVING
jgi:hypothetical protein